MLNQNLWNKILDARKIDPSMSITEIAKRSGISQGTLSKLIHGITISDEQWRELSKVLKTTVNEIMPSDIPEPAPESKQVPSIVMPFDYANADIQPESKIILWILNNTVFRNKTSFEFTSKIKIKKQLGLKSNSTLSSALKRLSESKLIGFDPGKREITVSIRFYDYVIK